MPYITVTALSHTGLRRDHNEDSLVVGPWTLCGTVTENPQTMVFPFGHPLVVAVADGMGGQPAGDVASSLVARRLAAFGPTLDSEDAVRDALALCNHAVYAAADRDPKLSMMGTTVAGVVVLEGELLVFNVGDSRVLDVGPAAPDEETQDVPEAPEVPEADDPADSDETLHQVSVDDSPPLPPGQRTTSIVTQSLGGAPGFSAITPHVSTSPIAPGKRIVVCTDGLTDPVPEDRIDAVLREHDGGRAVFELWRAAMEAGGPDNITIALVSVTD